jgi:periplasmic divalent cation tolerance protein
MSEDFLLVLITAPSAEVGEKIARRLLNDRLAACVNILPGVRSLYHWQGEIQDDQEHLLLVKTRQEVFESHLIDAVREIHPYQVPEIIALPIHLGLAEYLDWIHRETLAP